MFTVLFHFFLFISYSFLFSLKVKIFSWMDTSKLAFCPFSPLRTPVTKQVRIVYAIRVFPRFFWRRETGSHVSRNGNTSLRNLGIITEKLGSKCTTLRVKKPTVQVHVINPFLCFVYFHIQNKLFDSVTTGSWTAVIAAK